MSADVIAPNILPPSPVLTAKARLVFSSFFASSWAPLSSWTSRSARRFFRASTCLRLATSPGTRDAPGQKVIARVSRADFDLVAFAAEAFDGLEEEDFAVGHRIKLG